MDKIADTNVEQVTEGVKNVEIDSSKLTALSQEVISRQATVSPVAEIQGDPMCARQYAEQAQKTSVRSVPGSILSRPSVNQD